MFSSQLHARERANEIFLERHGLSLSKERREALVQRCSAQRDRYNGNMFRILFYSKLSVKERLSLFFYSNEILYGVRQGLYAFFSGR
ncbi:hypothetical protein D9M70_645470 [compost metagenome]